MRSKGPNLKRSNLIAIGNRNFRAGRLNVAEAFYRRAIDCYPDVSAFIEFNISLVVATRNSLKERGVYEEDGLDPDEITLLNSEHGIDTSELVHGVGTCQFRLDSVGPTVATGWAVALEDLDPVVLSVQLNSKNYAVVEASEKRRDVEKLHSNSRYSGYKIPLNEYITYSKFTDLIVSPISHEAVNSPNRRSEKLARILKGTHFLEPESVARTVCSKYLVENPSKGSDELKVSVIILNLNGRSVLRNCVQSLLKHNQDSEIIVVDHASTDGSVEMLHELNEPGRIKIVQREKNYSYSSSNNLAARKASGDILVFLNNDIVLTQDSISEMSRVLSHGEFGVVGLKLWDMPSGRGFTLNKHDKFPQHYGVHFRGVRRKETIEAFEIRESSFIDYESGILEVPALTAALMAISTSEFMSMGGFDEDYFYGQEDVDLCLRYAEIYDKKLGVIVDQGAFHLRGLSRKSLSKSNMSYTTDNRKYIQNKRGALFRKSFRKGQFERPGFWNQKPLSVAMIVSEIGFETDKADFFTAKELGDAFGKNDIVVGYFDSSSDYDVSGYDIVIVYIDGFDPRKLKRISPHAKIVAWARNWFDRWCERSWIEFYDVIYASSEKARIYMEGRLKRSVGLLRLAASSACIGKIQAVRQYKSDYVFTGSYFKSPREITDILIPSLIPFDFKLFGHNWESHKVFGSYTNGPVSYSDIPSVYASTSLVVDDANIATKKWGSINCRFFDALAAGKVCITNNSIGVRELFGEDDALVYDKNNLNERILGLLNNKSERLDIATRYQKEILEKHTYPNRAGSILSDIYASNSNNKIAIKIAAPDFERASRWGDYHFAVALRHELEALGYSVRIDCLHDWYSSRALDDDINIVLRGLDRFKTRGDQKNILWLISHPDLVCEDEVRDFDTVFVASDMYSDKLRSLTGLENIHFLPQASIFSTDNFNHELLRSTPNHELLFIGNSRNQYREVVRYCIEGGYPISVYGEGWENFIPSSNIVGNYIDNSLIPYYYHNANVVLNDHWPDMKRHGFISNRIFDVLMSGGRVISDFVPGIDGAYFHGAASYRTKEELYEILDDHLNNPARSSNERNADECYDYSFKGRAEVIHQALQS